MEKLNNEQIKTVVTWMETWEQLKNTAIPIRFKEDFEKQLYIPVVMCSSVYPLKSFYNAIKELLDNGKVRMIIKDYKINN